MIIRFKKGEIASTWAINVEVGRAIRKLGLQEYVDADGHPFGEIPVLKQVATKDFVIEIRVMNEPYKGSTLKIK